MPEILSADEPANCWADSENTVCTFVYKVTDNGTAAEVANWLLAKPLAIAILVIVAVIIRWVLHRLIDRFTARATKGNGNGLLRRDRNGSRTPEAAKIAAQRREQRAKTLGSVLKSIASGVIFSVMIFMAVAELGYNIAPLIASAGIVGVAIAFGAQSLVSDFVTGTFMMLEDQYGVGDEVDLGDAIGTVEAVTLRMTRVRDINGTVWYVRNGQISRVGNASQNWARSVVDVPISYYADRQQVREVLHEVARALWQKPEWHGIILEEPEIWGLERWDPDAIIFRVVLKTAPSKQWAVAREMRELISDRFDSVGLDIPLPQRVIHTHPTASATAATDADDSAGTEDTDTSR